MKVLKEVNSLAGDHDELVKGLVLKVDILSQDVVGFCLGHYVRNEISSANGIPL